MSFCIFGIFGEVTLKREHPINNMHTIIKVRHLAVSVIYHKVEVCKHQYVAFTVLSSPQTVGNTANLSQNQFRLLQCDLSELFLNDST